MSSDLRFKPKDFQTDPSSAATTSRIAGDMQKILSTAAVYLGLPGERILIEESRTADGVLLAARFREQPESELTFVYATRAALAMLVKNDPSNPVVADCAVLITDRTSIVGYLASQPQKQAVLAQCRKGIMEKIVWSYV